MALRYANGFRPRGGARELLKESLAALIVERNAKPWDWRYMKKREKDQWIKQHRKADISSYAALLGVSYQAALRRAVKQQKYLDNFLEYDL